MGCLICIGDLIMFILGLVVLIKGRVKLTSSRGVEGGVARLIGVILMSALLLGMVLPVGIAFAVIGGDALKFAQQQQGAGKGDMTPEQQKALEDKAKQIETPVNLLTWAGSGVPLLAAIILAAVCSKPLGKTRRATADRYEDEEDRPRRRRRDDEEDEDEDRPRRRRRDEDEGEDEDRPRRRRRDDDEDDDEGGRERVKRRD
jgi:hypothetical protein